MTRLTLSRPVRALLLAACVAVPQTAAAAEDSAGTPGFVQDLTLNTSKSSRFMEFQGSIVVQEGEAATASKREYRWGGTACSGYGPTEEQIRFLFEALRMIRALQVVPGYKLGAGNTRCLVSLKFRPRPVVPHGGP